MQLNGKERLKEGEVGVGFLVDINARRFSGLEEKLIYSFNCWQAWSGWSSRICGKGKFLFRNAGPAT
jgi:hypothetical protein